MTTLNEQQRRHGEMMAARIAESHGVGEEAWQRGCRKHGQFFKVNYLPHLPANKQATILDLGAGRGEFLKLLKNSGYVNARGIDLGESNVTWCRDHGLDVTHAEIAEYLRTHDETYDALVLSDVVEHFPLDTLQATLALFLARLKPGGVLIMKTINMANPLLAAHNRYVDITHTIGWTEESMRQILGEVGFDPVRVLPSHLYVFYANPLNYVAWFLAACFEWFFLFYFRLHGKNDAKVFTKNILAVAHRPLDGKAG